MLQRNLLRNRQLQPYSSVRRYEIRNLEGKLAAQAVVRVEYRAPDKKRFSKTSEKASQTTAHPCPRVTAGNDRWGPKGGLCFHERILFRGAFAAPNTLRLAQRNAARIIPDQRILVTSFRY